MNPHTLFLEMAKSDLEASKTLLSNKHYPQAIFLFEQAVEKGVKSIGLCMNIVTEEECKEIGHKAWNILKFTVERISENLEEYLEEILTDLQKISGEQHHLKQMELRSIAQELHKKMLEEAKKPQKLIYNLTGKNIDDLKDLAFCEEELEKLRNTMNMYNRLLDQLSKIFPLPSTDIKVIVKEIVTESLKASYYTAYLLILSIIAYPHTTNSRIGTP